MQSKDDFCLLFFDFESVFFLSSLLFFFLKKFFFCDNFFGIGHLFLLLLSCLHFACVAPGCLFFGRVSSVCTAMKITSVIKIGAVRYLSISCLSSGQRHIIYLFTQC